MRRKKNGSSFYSDRTEYTVGYRKPPKDKQFKPGTSGNPTGRPKKKATFLDELRKILAERIFVEIDGARVRITKKSAFIRSFVNQAIKGKPKPTQILWQHASSQMETALEVGVPPEEQDEAFRRLVAALKEAATVKSAPAYGQPRPRTPVIDSLLGKKSGSQQ